MHGNNEEHFTKLVAVRDKRKIEKYIYIVEFDHLEMFLCSFYVETTTTKTQHIRPVGYRLENSRFHFQKYLCKWDWSRD